MRCATATGFPLRGSSTNNRRVPMPVGPRMRSATGFTWRKSYSSQASAPSAASASASAAKSSPSSSGGGGGGGGGISGGAGREEPRATRTGRGRGRDPRRDEQPAHGAPGRAPPRVGEHKVGIGPAADQPEQGLDVRRVGARVAPHHRFVLGELHGHGVRKAEPLGEQLLGEF